MMRSRLLSSASGKTFAPVVIVGGGPSGLLLSNLLSGTYKVPSVLLEAQSVQERFCHPQAHFLNTRTVEILRYWLPEVYQDVLSEMSCVRQWRNFRFVANMSQMDPLAEVVHPVDWPLQANQDANGVIKRDGFVPLEKSSPLSTCSVGHLAQHTFCRILYDNALDCLGDTESKILYDTRVVDVSSSHESELIITTEKGQQFGTNLVVAADGSNSFVRNAFDIKFKGKEGIQHLMNIHVRLPDEQAQHLHFSGARNPNFAMLYSVLSPEVVAMVVCHNIGEYIIQIPFFPPYQSPEEDFSDQRLNTIVRAIFGPAVAPNEWTIESARPWAMSSLIAERYFDERGVALVGDAAHVFPPAGGFGMNTGIQDTHNLAWKIASVYHKEETLLRHAETRRALLESYSKDRRPIAIQNAALSVRNYKRLLGVTKSCYLDEQHPTLLKLILDKSPLPLSSRQLLFRSLLRAALYPLKWLEEPTASYTQHIRGNLEKVLRAGAGLPLLFPKFELYFDYDRETTNDSEEELSDTWAPVPILKAGRLLPHVPLKIVSLGKRDYPRLQVSDTDNTVSSSNLPIQMSLGALPTLVLACVGESFLSVDVKDLSTRISEETSLPVEVVLIVQSSASMPEQSEHLVLGEAGRTSGFSFFSSEQEYLVLVRPDGHVASIRKGSWDSSTLEESLHFLQTKESGCVM